MTGTEETPPGRLGEGRTDAKAQLLDAVSALMREGDTLDISLSEIATRARLNSALVKYYFGNKEGLLEGLLRRDVGEQFAKLGNLTALPMTPINRMRSHIETVITMYFRFPYLNRLLMRLIRDASPARAQAIADEFIKPIWDAYAVIIKEGQTRGEFKDVDPVVLYFNVLGACDPFFSARVVLRHCSQTHQLDDEFRRRYIAQTTETLLRGLLTPAGAAA